MESIHGDEHGASAGSLSEPVPELQIDEMPIARVREGMAVVDADGEKVGDVSLVHLGDPEAITLAGQEGAEEDRGFLDAIASFFGGGDEPKAPEAIRRRLIREGFIKINGGPLRHGWYAMSDQVAAVAGDTVRLNVDKDDLVKKGTD
jgi:hypothetical protein